MRERARMPRQGMEFQKLVAYLERAVADQRNVTVESPKFIPDKVTGDLREHDVVITQRVPQRETTTAIECRDHRRPVTVDQVEAFHTKCEEVTCGWYMRNTINGLVARRRTCHNGVSLSPKAKNLGSRERTRWSAEILRSSE